MPLDETLAAAGPPTEPQPIAELQSLPEAFLPVAVITAPTATEVIVTPIETAPPVVTQIVPASGSHTFAVAANAGWVDSGIAVSAGQSFRVSASGTIIIWNDCEQLKAELNLDWANCPDYIVGPNGGKGTAREFMDTEEQANGFPAPDEQVYGLLGRVGEGGDTFYIGAGGTFAAGMSGTLQFRVNDDDLNDNEGEFFLEIVIG